MKVLLVVLVTLINRVNDSEVKEIMISYSFMFWGTFDNLMD